MYEVEAKFQLPDVDAFRRSLKQQGFAAQRTEDHIDRYLRHPTRDFAETDEALRMRMVIRDRISVTVMTYKGPRDPGPVKAREEIETPVANPTQMSAIFKSLGFTPAAVVEKRREVFTRDTTTVTIDTVTDVGTYAEVEQLASGADRDAAAAVVLEVAAALGLPDSAREPRSYLELLLAGD